LGILGLEKYRGERVEENRQKKRTFGAAAPPSTTANRRVGAVSDHPWPANRRRSSHSPSEEKNRHEEREQREIEEEREMETKMRF